MYIILDVLDIDISKSLVLPQKVIHNINVFCSRVELQIVNKTDSTIVIKK